MKDKDICILCPVSSIEVLIYRDTLSILDQIEYSEIISLLMFKYMTVQLYFYFCCVGMVVFEITALYGAI